MKWGIVFSSTSFPDPDRAAALARGAEAAGFESLWAPEHVVAPVGANATPYEGSPDGRMDRLWRRGGIPDPLVWLSFAAAHTSTIQLGTNVVIVPEHQPVVLAKSVVTLDYLSRGRVQLGVGVGVLPEEYGAVGMTFENRGRRMDEALEAMKILWRDEVATFRGEYVSFEEVRCDPHPVRGHIPVHVGGLSLAARRRAATRGDGYFPFVPPGVDLESTLRETIASVREMAEEGGRDPSTIEMTAGGARSVEQAEKFRQLGVDRLVIAIRGSTVAEIEDEVAAFGATVIAETADL
jgi:probable F420-dependent oxidoreductase